MKISATLILLSVLSHAQARHVRPVRRQDEVETPPTSAPEAPGAQPDELESLVQELFVDPQTGQSLPAQDAAYGNDDSKSYGKGGENKGWPYDLPDANNDKKKKPKPGNDHDDDDYEHDDYEHDDYEHDDYDSKDGYETKPDVDDEDYHNYNDDGEGYYDYDFDHHPGAYGPLNPWDPPYPTEDDEYSTHHGHPAYPTSTDDAGTGYPHTPYPPYPTYHTTSMITETQTAPESTVTVTQEVPVEVPCPDCPECKEAECPPQLTVTKTVPGDCPDCPEVPNPTPETTQEPEQTSNPPPAETTQSKPAYVETAEAGKVGVRGVLVVAGLGAVGAMLL